MKTKDFSLNVTGTNAVCPVGETTGRDNINTGAIPVLSCEGACIRGEIARLAAWHLERRMRRPETPSPGAAGAAKDRRGAERAVS